MIGNYIKKQLVIDLSFDGETLLPCTKNIVFTTTHGVISKFFLCNCNKYWVNIITIEQSL